MSDFRTPALTALTVAERVLGVSQWIEIMTITQTHRRLPRWSLRTLFLLFIPLCMGLGWYSYVQRQRQAAGEAIDVLFGKGCDANISSEQFSAAVYFKNANVTDADLAAFIPAFNGYAPHGVPRVTKLRLNGSPVSDAALERFRLSVPDCEIER